MFTDFTLSIPGQFTVIVWLIFLSNQQYAKLYVKLHDTSVNSEWSHIGRTAMVTIQLFLAGMIFESMIKNIMGLS